MHLPYNEGGPITLSGLTATSAFFSQVFATYTEIDFINPVITPAADCRTVFVESRAQYTLASGDTHAVGYIWAIEVEDGQLTAARTYVLPAADAPSTP